MFLGLPARQGKMAAILCGALLPQCLDVAHHMLLEQTLHRHQANPEASARLDLTKVRRSGMGMHANPCIEKQLCSLCSDR